MSLVCIVFIRRKRSAHNSQELKRSIDRRCVDKTISSIPEMEILLSDGSPLTASSWIRAVQTEQSQSIGLEFVRKKLAITAGGLGDSQQRYRKTDFPPLSPSSSSLNSMDRDSPASSSGIQLSSDDDYDSDLLNRERPFIPGRGAPFHSNYTYIRRRPALQHSSTKRGVERYDTRNVHSAVLLPPPPPPSSRIRTRRLDHSDIAFIPPPIPDLSYHVSPPPPESVPKSRLERMQEEENQVESARQSDFVHTERSNMNGKNVSIQDVVDESFNVFQYLSPSAEPISVPNSEREPDSLPLDDGWSSSVTPVVKKTKKGTKNQNVVINSRPPPPPPLLVPTKPEPESENVLDSSLIDFRGEADDGSESFGWEPFVGTKKGAIIASPKTPIKLTNPEPALGAKPFDINEGGNGGKAIHSSWLSVLGEDTKEQQKEEELVDERVVKEVDAEGERLKSEKTMNEEEAAAVATATHLSWAGSPANTADDDESWGSFARP